MATNRLTNIITRQRRNMVNDSVFYVGLATFMALVLSPIF